MFANTELTIVRVRVGNTSQGRKKMCDNLVSIIRVRVRQLFYINTVLSLSCIKRGRRTQYYIRLPLSYINLNLRMLYYLGPFSNA